MTLIFIFSKIKQFWVTRLPIDRLEDRKIPDRYNRQKERFPIDYPWLIHKVDENCF